MEFFSPKEYKLKLEESLLEIKRSYNNPKNKIDEISNCELNFLKILSATYKAFETTNNKEYLKIFDETEKKYDNLIEKAIKKPISKISFKPELDYFLEHKYSKKILSDLGFGYGFNNLN